jgi:hypothetical protein
MFTYPCMCHEGRVCLFVCCVCLCACVCMCVCVYVRASVCVCVISSAAVRVLVRQCLSYRVYTYMWVGVLCWWCVVFVCQLIDYPLRRHC